MKRWLAMLLAIFSIWSFAGCGADSETEQSAADSGSVPASGTPVEDVTEETSRLESGSVTAEMIYFKDLGDGAIMAACYGEGRDLLGGDYYVVHVGDAVIYNAQGEEIPLEQLVRGCPIQVTWPGMVMESYPGQFSAEVVTALSDEAMDGVPPEDEIPSLFGGPKWWEEETVTEVPPLILTYSDDIAVTSVQIDMHTGSWAYSEEGTFSSGGTNAVKDGLPPQEWTFDDNNTIKRGGFDTVTLSTAPEADQITVTAYALEGAEETELQLGDGNVLTLLDGDYIYVVHCVWDGANKIYQGAALYGFKVAAP